MSDRLHITRFVDGCFQQCYQCPFADFLEKDGISLNATRVSQLNKKTRCGYQQKANSTLSCIKRSVESGTLKGQPNLNLH